MTTHVAWVVMIDDNPRHPVGPTRYVSRSASYTSLTPTLYFPPCIPSSVLLPSPYTATPLFAALEKCRGVYQQFPFGTPLHKRSRGPASSLAAILQVLSFQSVRQSFASFCTFEKLKLFVFKCFRTLAKTPGGGGVTSPPTRLNWLSPTPSAKIASLPIPACKWTGQSRTHYGRYGRQ